MGNQFGERLRKLREEKGLNQEELAERATLSQSFLSFLETGEKLPTIRSLCKLAEALNKTPEELVTIYRK